MPSKYSKTDYTPSLETFLKIAKAVKNFSSSGGKKYSVNSFQNNVMKFTRLDANVKTPWDMDLENLFEAYQQLDDFRTINFKPYVKRMHSPARGLLLHLGMLV